MGIGLLRQQDRRVQTGQLIGQRLTAGGDAGIFAGPSAGAGPRAAIWVSTVPIRAALTASSTRNGRAR